MLSYFLIVIAKPASEIQFLHWLRSLGGLGLIPLGVLDNSLVPLPGSMDVFVVLLAADQRDWWPITHSWAPPVPYWGVI